MFTNQQVAEAFAIGAERQGGNVRTYETSDGTIVFQSYGTPIAIRRNEYADGRDSGVALVDDYSYSNTTSCQTSRLWYSLHSRGIEAKRIGHRRFRELCRAHGVILCFAR